MHMEWEETMLEEGKYGLNYSYTAKRMERGSENKGPRGEEWGSTVCDIVNAAWG